MEIERVNENTVKFYISYMDIEDRGFNREEIWYNRERSEQLFWQVMEEVDDVESFRMDGPLWIQVQAMEKGLEITVTKAQLSKDGQNLELPMESETMENHLSNQLDNLFELSSNKDNEEESTQKETKKIERFTHYPIAFESFEDVIQLSHRLTLDEGIEAVLHHYKNQYILIIKFNEHTGDDKNQDDLLSVIYEYGTKKKVAIPMILEYGKVIFSENALEQTKHYFK